MSTFLNNAGITFGDNTTQNTAATLFTDIYAIKNVYSQVSQCWAFSNQKNWDARMTVTQAARTPTYYVTRGVYYSTGIALDVAGTILIDGLTYPGGYTNVTGAYDTVSYTNSSSKSVRVRINALSVNPAPDGWWDYNTYPYSGGPSARTGRSTDDYEYHTVYRNGTPSSPTAHSGGTALITGQPGSQRFYDTIPPNTTYTYWHYVSLGGSSGDSLATDFYVEFCNFV